MNVKTSSMDLAFLARVRRMSLVSGAVAAVPVATYWGLWSGGAWLGGVAWSVLNLYFIGEVIRNVITPEDRDTMKIVGAVAVKFPVLYGLGFLLLWIEQLPAAGLVCGFSWPFAVMVLKAAARAWLNLDETETRERPDQEGKPSQA